MSVSQNCVSKRLRGYRSNLCSSKPLGDLRVKLVRRKQDLGIVGLA